jgi:hypothetical protein
MTWPVLIWEVQDMDVDAIEAARIAEATYILPNGNHKREKDKLLFPNITFDRLRWNGPAAGVGKQSC